MRNGRVALERVIHPLAKLKNRHFPSPGTVGIWLRAGLLLLAYPLLRRMLPLPALVRFYSGKAGRKKPMNEVELIRVIQRLLQTNRAMFRPNCMKQSLLLLHFLRRSGRDARIHFGVSKTADDELHGHAWVSLNGSPIAEKSDPLERFAVTFTFPEIPGDKS